MISFEQYLSGNRLLPISKWHSMRFWHTKPGSEEERARQFDTLRRAVEPQGDQCGGLYLYEQRGKVLYVGKAARLFHRLKSHYRESFEQVPGDTSLHTWHEFFKAHAGEVLIRWHVLDDEAHRAAAEIMLAQVLTLTFKLWRKEFEQIARRS